MGSHNQHILKYNRNTLGVEAIGCYSHDKNRVVTIETETGEKTFLKSTKRSIYNHNRVPVHITVDGDVTEGFPARHDWQRTRFDNILKLVKSRTNNIDLSKLNKDIQRQLRKYDVVGFDVGGLHFPRDRAEMRKYKKRKDVLVDPNSPEAREFAIRYYRTLMETYFKSIEKRNN